MTLAPWTRVDSHSLLALSINWKSRSRQEGVKKNYWFLMRTLMEVLCLEGCLSEAGRGDHQFHFEAE